LNPAAALRPIRHSAAPYKEEALVTSDSAHSWRAEKEGRALSRRAFLKEVGVAGAGLAAVSLVGCDSPTRPARPPRGELVVLQGTSPHVRVLDAATHGLLRQADVPNFLRWSWNDDANYFDGQNLWLGAMTPAHGSPGFEGVEVLLLDLDSLTVTARIALGSEGTMVNPTTGVSNAMLNIGRATPVGRVLIGKMFMGEVVVVDSRSRAVLASKKLLDGPDWVCDSDFGVASDGRQRLYVVTNNTGKLVSVDPSTLVVLESYTAPAGVRPYMITVSPDGNRVWVQNTFAAGYAGERLGLTVFDARTLAVLKQINTGRIPIHATFSPDGRLAYVGHADGPYVTVVDAASLEVLRQLEAGGNAASVAVHPDGKSIFVRVSGTDNYIVPVDTSTWQVGARLGVSVAGGMQSGLYMRRLT
jgi:DNA-binding beta-propeller fold protein YncE